MKCVVKSGDETEVAEIPPEQAGGDLGSHLSLPELSPRLRQVAQLVCEGYSNPEIANELGVSSRTIKSYVNLLGLTLGVTRRELLIPLCFKAGIADGSKRKSLPEMMPYERRITVKVIEGLTYGEIAVALKITISTVKNVMRNVHDKCGVWSRYELVSRYVS